MKVVKWSLHLQSDYDTVRNLRPYLVQGIIDCTEMEIFA